MRVSRAQAYDTTTLVYLLAVASVLIWAEVVEVQSCPVTGCIGCGGEDISCESACLTSFPQLPVDDQRNTKTLRLRHNLISSLEASDLQNYTALTLLDLANNSLSELLENVFEANTQLQTLYLHGNQLTELPQELFFNNPALETLFLSDNLLTQLPQFIFAANTMLEFVKLGNNLLTEVPENLFHANQLLDGVNLDSNRLTAIPEDLFLESTRLTDINLKNNSLSELPENLFPLHRKLATLDLCDNLLTGLPEYLFTMLDRPDVVITTDLQYLHLENNPLNCDCELRWLPGFVDVHFRELTITGDCVAPANLEGSSLVLIEEEQFVCDCDCVNGVCDGTVGVCDCSAGYFGENCTIMCLSGSWGANCLQSCTCVADHSSSCDVFDGACTCLPGYIGENCQSECTPGTWGIGCLQNCTCLGDHAHESSPCDITNGTCNCLPGYTGDDCETDCPYGRYGQDCLSVCQCQNDATCDPVTGVCTCTAGWTGSTCNTSCPEGTYGQHCLEVCPECANNSTCDIITGNCTCQAGWTGLLCDTRCSEGQYGQDCQGVCQCQNNATCNTTNGGCTCTAGWTGSSCDTVSSPDHHTGKACTPGTWGADCLQECTCSMVREAICDAESGTCQCLPGFTGPNCELGCPPGTWGTGCLQNCSCVTDHVSTSCDIVDGFCYCLSGYTGDDCSVMETSASDTSTAVITGSVGGVLALIIIVVLVVIVTLVSSIVRKKRSNKAAFMLKHPAVTQPIPLHKQFPHHIYDCVRRPPDTESVYEEIPDDLVLTNANAGSTTLTPREIITNSAAYNDDENPPVRVERSTIVDDENDRRQQLSEVYTYENEDEGPSAEPTAFSIINADAQRLYNSRERSHVPQLTAQEVIARAEGYGEDLGFEDDGHVERTTEEPRAEESQGYMYSDCGQNPGASTVQQRPENSESIYDKYQYVDCFVVQESPGTSKGVYDKYQYVDCREGQSLPNSKTDRYPYDYVDCSNTAK